MWSDSWPRVLALAAGLGLAEYLRGTVLTGFPWNAIGYAATTLPILMQKASVLGIYGVTTLAIAVFAVPAVLASGTRRSSVAIPAILAIVLVCCDLGYGWYRLSSAPAETSEPVRIRVVQPAIDQSKKWTPELQDSNFALQLELSRSAAKGGTEAKKPDVLVWPESTFPFILTERRDALAALGELIEDGQVLLAGAVRVEPPAPGNSQERVFNSVYVIDDDGAIAAAADKVHLVPFGEYLPFQDLAEAAGLEQLTHLRGGFEAGSGHVTLEGGKSGKFLPLICYEIIFPGQARAPGERPDWLLNLTNDAWFGYSPGPHQHWRQAIVRSVEEGLPLVRAANDGISSVSDSYGRIIARTGLGERTVLDANLPQNRVETLYSRFGNGFFWAAIVVFAAVASLSAGMSTIRSH